MLNENLASIIAQGIRVPSALTIADAIAGPLAGIRRQLELTEAARAVNSFSGLNSSVAAAIQAAAAPLASMQNSSAIAAALRASSFPANIASSFAIGSAMSDALRDAIAANAKLPVSLSTSLSSLAAIVGPNSKLARQLAEMNSVVNSSSISPLLQPNYLAGAGISKAAADVALRFKELNELQQAVFGGLRVQAAAALPVLPLGWLTQNQSIQSTIGSVLSDLAEQAIKTGNWEDLDYGIEIGETVLTFGDQLLSRVAIAKEAVDAFVAWMERMMTIIILLPKHKAMPYVSFLLLLLGVFSDSIGVGTFLKEQIHPAPEPARVQIPSNLATKADVALLNQKFEQMRTVLTLVAAQEGEGRTVARTALIKAKPSSDSFTIGKAIKGTTVVVLRKQKKWVYISCQDMDDQPMHGWVQKKYLARL
jgi:hypothetical protein